MLGKDLDLAIRRGDFESELVVDPESPFEVFFSLPLYMGITAMLGSALYLCLSFFKVVDAFDDHVWGWMGKGILLVVLGIFLRSMVDLHYTLNSELRKVILCWRIGPLHFRHKVCDFDKVDHLLIDSVALREEESRTSGWGIFRQTHETGYYSDKHRYGLLLVRRRGLSVRLLDRSYPDFFALQDRARRVAETLEVELRGRPGDANRGRNSVSTSGCLQGCGMLILFVVFVNMCAGGKAKPPRKGERASKSASSAGSLIPGTPVRYGKLLDNAGFKRQGKLLEYGLVNIKTNLPMWNAICASHIPGSKPHAKGKPTLFSALLGSDAVVSAMAKKLKLTTPSSEDTTMMIWRDKITLTIKMDFAPDEQSLPLLVRNLQLGLERMAIGSPRDGQARLTLVMSPEAHKPEVQPGDKGFTLIMPSAHAVQRADLGLAEPKAKP